MRYKSGAEGTQESEDSLASWLVAKTKLLKVSLYKVTEDGSVFLKYHFRLHLSRIFSERAGCSEEDWGA